MNAVRPIRLGSRSTSSLTSPLFIGVLLFFTGCSTTSGKVDVPLVADIEWETSEDGQPILLAPKKIRLPERGQDWMNCRAEHIATSLDIGREDLFDRCYCDRKIDVNMTPACDPQPTYTAPKVVEVPRELTAAEIFATIHEDIDGYRNGVCDYSKEGGGPHCGYLWVRVRANTPFGEQVSSQEREVE